MTGHSSTCVALAVKLGLARQLAESGDTEMTLTLLEQLRTDVQETVQELADFAHGIYPPLLRDRGLHEALRAAAGRSPLACRVTVDLPVATASRWRHSVLLLSRSHAKCREICRAGGATDRFGDGDRRAVELEVSDDGQGFDVAGQPHSNGFLNMADRLGASCGGFGPESAVDAGTTVRGTLPAQPLPVAAQTKQLA